MAGITLAQAEARLTEYMAAEARILDSQAYKIGDREQTRAQLKEVREGIELWDKRVKQLDRGNTARVRRGQPIS